MTIWNTGISSVSNHVITSPAVKREWWWLRWWWWWWWTWQWMWRRWKYGWHAKKQVGQFWWGTSVFLPLLLFLHLVFNIIWWISTDSHYPRILLGFLKTGLKSPLFQCLIPWFKSRRAGQFFGCTLTYVNPTDDITSYHCTSTSIICTWSPITWRGEWFICLDVKKSIQQAWLGLHLGGWSCPLPSFGR